MPSSIVVRESAHTDTVNGYRYEDTLTATELSIRVAQQADIQAWQEGIKTTSDRLLES